MSDLTLVGFDYKNCVLGFASMNAPTTLPDRFTPLFMYNSYSKDNDRVVYSEPQKAITLVCGKAKAKFNLVSRKFDHLTHPRFGGNLIYFVEEELDASKLQLAERLGLITFCGRWIKVR